MSKVPLYMGGRVYSRDIVQAGDNPVFAKPNSINPRPLNSPPTAHSLQPTATPYHLFPTPYTSTLETLRPTPFIKQPTPYHLLPTPYTSTLNFGP